MTKKATKIKGISLESNFLSASNQYPAASTIGYTPNFVTLMNPKYDVDATSIEAMYFCLMDQSSREQKSITIEITTEKDFLMLLQEAREEAKRIGTGATISQFLGKSGEVPPYPPTHSEHRPLPYFVSPHSWESKVNLIFDYATYLKASPYTKKKMCLDAIHTGMLALSKQEGFDPAMLNNTYQRCLDEKLVFHFLHGSNTICSPNHRYFGTVECCWDDVLTATAVIRDRQGKEVLRQEIGREEESPNFILYTDLPRWKGGSFGLEGKLWFELEKDLRSWYVEVYKPEPSAKNPQKEKKVGSSVTQKPAEARETTPNKSAKAGGKHNQDK